MTESEREYLANVSAALYSMEAAFSKVIIDAHANAQPTYVVLTMPEVSSVVRDIRGVNRWLKAAGVPVAMNPLTIVKEEG